MDDAIDDQRVRRWSYPVIVDLVKCDRKTFTGENGRERLAEALDWVVLPRTGKMEPKAAGNI
jgi:hypothetical protein